ncbi:MAG TPA: ATP synthase F1 subunit epsilon [Acidimicrobiales bacterium]|nr:ATP synthase F1 subunit epsilon [Acidimicrobiales bacterium]
MTLAVKVVSPERLVFDQEASMVVCRTTEGEIAFQTGHAPFIGLLGIGTVRVYPSAGGAPVSAAVHGGFVEVRDNQVSVLSDIAELPDQVDTDRARADQADAEGRLGRDRDDEEAAADLRWAQVRLEVAGAVSA